jgi:dTDP-4-dehydrorhamnose reductase
MRLLITGASGLLGLNLALHATQSHTVTGVDRGTLAAAPFDVINQDLLGSNAIGRILESSRPDAVIHCAAAADVDFCEGNPQLAHQLNAIVPGRIAAACASCGVRLMHISTDAVFDGKKAGSYLESDLAQPSGAYAVTKRAGEEAVLEASSRAIVARVNFYGWSLGGRRSLAEFFVNNLRLGHGVQGFTDVTFCPMFVADLAETLIRMLEADLHGLYHVVGTQAMTKFQFGVAIARRFGFDENLITPGSVDGFGLAARRSHNLQLSTHKLSTDLGGNLPDFSTGLAKFYTGYTEDYPQKIQTYQQVPGPQRPVASHEMAS